ncbi:MAG: response regulator transcription factor [Clostridia bacterium]|nr:response regulator transcription factor [Clostridia bacterium]
MKRILIIEDDKSISEIQRDYLTMSGYAVDCAFDGEEGLAKLRQGGFDLAILDIMLPKMDGFSILETLAEEKRIPILVVSARDEEFFKIRGLNLGADDYIIKPFSMAELVARVKNRLKVYDKMKDKPKDSIQIRDLSIHKEDRRVFVQDREVTLTQKEFDLLCFLAENPNRVYDKESLYEKVWGFDALSDTTTVTVHMARIREKIEANPAKPQYIETVWGAGYRMHG